MKFDVVIGNPPYQEEVGNKGGNSSKAQAVYHLFISSAISLNPKYISMITPSRWMTKSAAGVPNKWVDEMLNSNKFCVMHDYQDSSMVFPTSPPRGGVNHFVWNRDYNGMCKRYYHQNSIDGKTTYDNIFGYLDGKGTGFVFRDMRKLFVVDKIEIVEGDYYREGNFSDLVSPKDFYTDKVNLTSRWSDFKLNKTNKHNIKYYLNKRQHKVDYGFVSIKQIPKNKESVNHNKIFIPAASGNGRDMQVLGQPLVGGRNSVSSQTYLVIGYDPIEHNFTDYELNSIVSYIKTKFFRHLVSIVKITQNGARGVYKYVPLQDFTSASDIDWTQSIADIDQQLYKKYGLNEEEIKFIETNVKEME